MIWVVETVTVTHVFSEAPSSNNALTVRSAVLPGTG
jgi:hypothetical protein